ncbi:hypothetical protein R5H30_14200 [Sulfitobacter sp. D35]|uniref:hypothetical protein n=1 Tax=Sulfitobacter sp. D35 TaxID=3083252 RepID=UPI00296E810B|nr:hypothetical protein [Sulfitobacter sp. D35]MDW4499144.1 hypothetical protein [Sulfitobacter sp. D35]
MEMETAEELPLVCDCLADECLMENVIYVLKVARLEHFLVSGLDLDAARELSELEATKRREAFQSGAYFRSVLGGLAYSQSKNEFSLELELSAPAGTEVPSSAAT